PGGNPRPARGGRRLTTGAPQGWRQAQMRARRLIFTTGPWHSDWGEQDEPRQVVGIQVARELLRREGGGGALVVLADGRFALTGATFAAGSARALMRHASRRSRCAPDGDRA